MGNEPKNRQDDAVKRILIIFIAFGLVCFLPSVVWLYFPDHTDFIWRLVVTLVFAVIIVMVHRKIEGTNRPRDDASMAPHPRRSAVLMRILGVWLVLFLLNTLFLAD